MALLHQEELTRNWELARDAKPLERSIRSPNIRAITGKRPEWIIRGLVVLGDHQLRLLFEDGTVGDVSFQDRTWSGVLAPLQDPDYFAAVEILGGTVHWRRDDLDLAPEPLYETAKANGLIRPLAEAAA